MESNFNFLKETIFGDISELPMASESFVFSDPNQSINLAGQFCEVLTKKLLTFEHIYFDEKSLTQCERISVLSEYNLIPDSICSFFHQIRQDRNKTAHVKDFNERIIFNSKQSILNLQRVFNISEWFMKSYCQVSKRIPLTFDSTKYKAIIRVKRPVNPVVRNYLKEENFSEALKRALLLSDVNILSKYKEKLSDKDVKLQQLINFFIMPLILTPSNGFSLVTISENIKAVYESEEDRRKAYTLFKPKLCELIQSKIKQVSRTGNVV